MKSSRILAAFVALVSTAALAQTAPDPNLVVTNGSDDGTAGTLRYAINYANTIGAGCPSSVGPAPTITFSSATTPLVIRPATPLPTISCPTGVVIDGGGTPNTLGSNSGSLNTGIVVEIDGSACTVPPAMMRAPLEEKTGTACDGLTVSTGGGVSIGGLAIHSFAGDGVVVEGGNATLSGTFIGTDSTGVATGKGNHYGVNVAGGTLYAGDATYADERNLITGNSAGGIYAGAGAYSIYVRGNLIGGTKGGGGGLGNGIGGVIVAGGAGSITAIVQNNHIRYNTGPAITAGRNNVQISQNVISGNAGNAVEYASQPFSPPTIDSFSFDGTYTTVNLSAPNVGGFTPRVEVFNNPANTPSNTPTVIEGQSYFGSSSVSTLSSDSLTRYWTVTAPGTLIFPTATVTVQCDCSASPTSQYAAPVFPPLATVTPDAGFVLVGQQTTITVALDNVNAVQTVSGINFAYSLPSPLQFGAGSVTYGGECGTSSITQTSSGFQVSNLTMAPDTQCLIHVPVLSNTAGAHPVGSTGDIASSLGTGGTLGSTVLLVTQPNISALPSTLDFGSVPAGTATTQVVTIMSSGTAPLTISGVSALTSIPSTSTAFTVQSQTCTTAGPIAAGGTCQVTVAFAPSASGTYAGQLKLTSDAPSSPYTVTLAGTGTAPSLHLSTTSLVFAGQTLGTPSAAQSVAIDNTGTANLTITSAVSSAPSEFAVSGCTSGTVAPGGPSCVVQVTFTPAAGGARSATITITSNDASSPHTVNVSGTGIVPAPTVSPASYNFGNVPVGGNASTPFTITNGNSVAIPVSAGVASAGFSAASACPTTLAAGASCTVTVSFAPTAVTAFSGTLQVTSPGTTPSVVDIPLSGTGTAALVPVLTLSSTSLTFPSTLVGTASSPLSVVATNSGTATLNVSTVTFTGTDFTASGCAGASLAPGATCSISVTFQPGAAGTRSGSISIASNDAASPATVTLSGTGIMPAPALQLSATSLTFPLQQVGTTSSAQNVILTSSGVDPLHITSIATSGDFGYSGCGYPVTLAPGTSCTFAITFSPSANGALTGSITVVSDAPGSPHTIALSGTGVAGPQPGIFVSPSSVGFGDVRVGTQGTIIVTITSNGTAPLAISSIASTGAGFSQMNNCPSSLPAGSSCDVTVLFLPSSDGPQAGQLVIGSNGDPPTVRVPLSGNGVPIPPAVLAVDRLLDFGQHVIGTTTRMPLDLRNTGEQALNISGLQLRGTGFALEGSCSSIPAGGACTLTVVFAPAAVATFTGRLDIASNDARGVIGVDLLGQGLAVPRPEIELSVDGIGFPNQLMTTQSVSQTVGVRSAGSAPLHVRGISVSGPFVLAGSCPATMPPESRCEVSVSFLPMAPGPAEGRLTVDSDAEAGRGFASLTGTGCRFFSVTGNRILTRPCDP